MSRARDVASGTRWLAGEVVQAKYANNNWAYQTISSATPVALTGLSLSITPKFANSIILIQGMVTASWTYVSSLHIYRDGTELIANHGSNSQSGGATALWTHYQSSQEASRPNQVFPFPVLYADSPNSTSSITYDFRANSGWSGGTEILYLNTRESNDMRGTSTISVMEIRQ